FRLSQPVRPKASTAASSRAASRIRFVFRSIKTSGRNAFFRCVVCPLGYYTAFSSCIQPFSASGRWTGGGVRGGQGGALGLGQLGPGVVLEQGAVPVQRIPARAGGPQAGHLVRQGPAGGPARDAV